MKPGDERITSKDNSIDLPQHLHTARQSDWLVNQEVGGAGNQVARAWLSTKLHRCEKPISLGSGRYVQSASWVRSAMAFLRKRAGQIPGIPQRSKTPEREDGKPAPCRVETSVLKVWLIMWHKSLSQQCWEDTNMCRYDNKTTNLCSLWETQLWLDFDWPICAGMKDVIGWR